ncbi:MAG: uL30 family ribosomal protein [Pyrinomonadaceae bacterium]
MTDESNGPDKKPGPQSPRMIRIEYYHSAADAPREQQVIIHQLGFTQVGQIITRPNTREIHQMVEKVPHLIRIIE